MLMKEWCERSSKSTTKILTELKKALREDSILRKRIMSVILHQMRLKSQKKTTSLPLAHKKSRSVRSELLHRWMAGNGVPNVLVLINKCLWFMSILICRIERAHKCFSSKKFQMVRFGCHFFQYSMRISSKITPASGLNKLHNISNTMWQRKWGLSSSTYLAWRSKVILQPPLTHSKKCWRRRAYTEQNATKERVGTIVVKKSVS